MPDPRPSARPLTEEPQWTSPPPTTGSQNREPEDDFQLVDGPSLAAIHRQWLDRGLPASTWTTYLARWQDTQTPTITHTHAATLPCHPACRRWGTN